MKPIHAGTNVRVRVYPIVHDAVEGWVTYGVNRAYKHVANPTREAIVQAVEQSVLAGLCELFDFDEQ